MMNAETYSHEILRNFGNGLILRRANPQDGEALVEFHERVQGQGEWTRMLVDGSHPTTNTSEFTLVEDIQTGKIVSSMCMIPQIWTYGGVEFGVARLEMVSTDEAYRWRGLVRAQFEQHHLWSKARGHLMQLVVGRPWIYRKFGYIHALPFARGREFPKLGLPLPTVEESLPYRIRPALEDDIPYCTRMFAQDQDRSLVWCVRDENQWRFDIFRRNQEMRLQLRVIATSQGEPVGALLHAPEIDDTLISLFMCELAPGLSWLEVSPAILQYLYTTGLSYGTQAGVNLEGFNLGLGLEHPLYQVLEGAIERRYRAAPFDWYVRVPDLAKFINHIAFVLEGRLKSSIAVGYSGKLQIDFYRRGCGLAISFDQGRLVSVENGPVEGDGIQMPEEMFIQLLFGYHSLQELEAYSAEVLVKGKERVLLSTLFPQKESRILSIW